MSHWTSGGSIYFRGGGGGGDENIAGRAPFKKMVIKDRPRTVVDPCILRGAEIFL